MNNNFKTLESSLGYSFTDQSLLKEALSHPSLKQVNHDNVNYERFEMLGDSILGFLVTEMIFNRFRSCDEGNIAKIKAYAVSCDTIVEIAKTIDLPNYMIMTKGEESTNGRSNRNNVENTMEALIAAIYLDSNIETTRTIIENFWKNHIENVDFRLSDPKTYLQEILQKNHDSPVYQLIKQDGPSHSPIFTIQVSSKNSKIAPEIATGKSIKNAEKDAAKKMIQKIQK